MNRLLSILSLVLVVFTSCKKEHDAVKQAKDDDAAIRTYITANHITAEKHSSGLYFQILEPGNGENPSANANVEVKYIGELLDGTVFDQTKTSSIKFPLSGVIRGWQIGIPLVKKGGKIKLLIPSALGYGNSSPGRDIPANSVLIFEVELLNVQ